jgi:hypothetical protein
LDETKLAVTFTEWERRYREESEQFWSEAQQLREAPETYGEVAARYFAKLYAELFPDAQ